ncbi:hypothetical protein [Paenibacillus sp. IHBB 3054]|uniref:hypothetical protein n=1 Tax=Paenibacillus sp. IHBB 3054 TaxID=3425689 RepID=UPI003F67F879
MEQKGQVLEVDFMDIHKMENFGQGFSIKGFLEQEQFLDGINLSIVNEVTIPAKIETKYPTLKEDIISAIKEIQSA